jgi:lipid A 3-O-deacylase
MPPMHAPARRTVQLALLLAAFGSAPAANAADVLFAVGGVYGYGGGTNIYGVQAVWTPPSDNEILDRRDLGLRLTAQVSRWVARQNQAAYHSLTDGNVMAELRYWLTSTTSLRPFVEAGFGFHLLSHVHIADRDMTTAFNFGSQAAAGLTFGDNGRYEIAALIHHASNGGIKEPNNGLTYGGIRFRIALP